VWKELLPVDGFTAEKYFAITRPFLHELLRQGVHVKTETGTPLGRNGLRCLLAVSSILLE
jgi:hypothetical protein